jgi:hypothetical protein
MSSKEMWLKHREKCYCFKEDKCTAVYEPPETCNFEECPLKTRFEWIQPSIACVLCDFGQCPKCSLVMCKECKATLCLDHIEKHLRTCRSGIGVYAKFRYEQEVIDGKPWVEA